ncbi:MAG: septal ring lytic transglycosylase RlpA family protein [Candidatus Delongbacteria bacterium]|nr:septal ring lytic transglycosylase RlpA family protein [bacterium]MBL7033619.1 septal ring lytic transglycosylase RlpA family protein [Candidatus Delongbacteria bacterium]
MPSRIISLTAILLAGWLVLLSCSPAPIYRQGGEAGTTGQRWVETGMASWYGSKFQGRPTASGEIFDMNEISAAHKTLPLGTRVRVTNLANDRELVLRINDRGPFIKGRIIDCSREAARQLGFLQAGITRVRVEVVSWPAASGG